MQNDWISVTQKLPDPMEKLSVSRHVLCYDGESRMVCYYDYTHKEWTLAHGWRIDGSTQNVKVTHWMDLQPKP